MRRAGSTKYESILLIILIVMFSFSCSPDYHENGDKNQCGQVPCYEGPFDPPWVSGLLFYDQRGHWLSHDNRVLETENFLTFSDVSSDEVKIKYSELAENSFSFLKNQFRISDSSEFGIIDRDSKMTIYSNRYKDHNQAAFSYGFILFAIDSSRYPVDTPEMMEWYQREITHETMHVVQAYLSGNRQQKHVWFTEGIAEHISGGAHPQIVNWESVVLWRSHPDHYKNPISIVIWGDFPVPDMRVGEYYSMFGLAVRYILHDKGLARSYMDIKKMYNEINSGENFNTAFLSNIGISVDEYEDNFYARIEEFFINLKN